MLELGRLAWYGSLQLFEEQEIAWLQRQVIPDQVGRGASCREAALLVPPGMDRDLAQRRIDRHLVHRFEHALRQQRGDACEMTVDFDAECLACDRGIDPGQQLSSRGNHTSGDDVEVDERPGARAVVHPVIDQAGMPPDRDALPSRLQICLVGDSVLEVAELVADVGEKFDQRDAKVRLMPLRPARRDDRQVVEHRLAEAGIVLRHVVDERLGGRRRGTVGARQAIEAARTSRLEAEIDLREGGIQQATRDDESVVRKIANPIDAHVDAVANPVR